ncbi:MOSC domain-containing protein [Nocardiopsis tropica]|uniref:MOSC domain-containing protein n=1 Tax=Streptomonospora nanhaiensis TaxID=1323731 RepID=A0ABY6YWL9_9ACTN|nr:MOSC domain-containing protein [Streptomonospora nanhaiensis]MEE2043208.1 MOSC domain-containing protein [Nocardiopsis tropica]WAE76391.1 MOSC domain-containing protein [Streptomonospora nanhaiensis]
MGPVVESVSSSPVHAFSKDVLPGIRLLAGLGVEGDAHMGATVKHRSRVAVDPTRPNLRQVHLIHAELLEELAAAGFAVAPGQLGENVTTRGLDLLALSTGTVLCFGGRARVEVTGLRNPCLQIDGFAGGLLKRLVHRDGDGGIVRRAGVMGVVLEGGPVEAGMPVEVSAPAGEHSPLVPV